MTQHEFTGIEAATAAVARLRARHRLVHVAPNGGVDVQTGHGWVYQFDVRDAGDALRWIEHLACKTWFTQDHAIALAANLADHFGVRYR